MKADKARDKTLAEWEARIPAIIECSARDLKFLLTIQELDNLAPGNDGEASVLLARAWQLDQAGFDFELDDERFTQDITEARNFIRGPDFEEYVARFERYIV